MNRTVVLALSEASPVLVDRFCAAGVMPNLVRLRAEGLSGRTRYSTPYLLTPQMWATILTGRTPGSHGIFDYWHRDAAGRFREVRGQHIRGPRLWDALAERQLASGWLNVPMTYPPPATPGFALSGQDAPGAHPSIAHPRALYRELTGRFGRYHHKDIFPGGQAKHEYGALLPGEVLWQGDIAEALARRDDWRFLMVYSSGTAFGQHYFWDDMADPDSPAHKVAERTFAASDALLGRLMGVLGPDDTIFVISECGAGPITSGVRLNGWLERHGYLARSRTDAGPSRQARWLAKVRTEAQRRLPKRAFHLANSLPIKDWLQSRIAADRIDWTQTRAYHRGKGEGNVYLNLRGRERHGIVEPADYETLRSELIETLPTLVDPATGERAIAAVHRREDLFGKGSIAAAPDLVIEWRGAGYMPSEDPGGGEAVFGPRVREYMTWPTSGSHRPEGLFVASGPGIRRGTLDRPVELVDLAPTWLHSLGCPTPAGMEGTARGDVFAG